MKTTVSAKKARALATELDHILNRQKMRMASLIEHAHKLANSIVDKKGAFWFFCNVREFGNLFKSRADFGRKECREGLLSTLGGGWRWYDANDYYFWAAGKHKDSKGVCDPVVSDLKESIRQLEIIVEKLKACAQIGDPLILESKEAILITEWVAS